MHDTHRCYIFTFTYRFFFMKERIGETCQGTWLSKAEPKDFSQTSRDLPKRAAGFLLP
jgi:hypothetical protein